MKKKCVAPSDTVVGKLFQIFEHLSAEDRAEFNKLYGFYDGRQTVGANTFGGLAFNEETSPQTYLEALRCPNCQSQKLVKHGSSDSNNPRYKCLVCKKTFCASTNTLSSNSIQDIGTWTVFVKGLLRGETYESLAKLCGISTTTVRNWRLKVFVALERLSEEVKLSGLVFADDTRIPYNFKGKHGDEFIAPRNSHNRGGQTTMKNHQKNEICVLCAIDANRNSFSRCIGFGTPSGKRLSNGFSDKLNVDENMVLITDGAQTYGRTVKDYGIPQWERRVTKKVNGKRFPNTAIGDMHIQIINNYHKRLKDFLAGYHGVASRFLPGYLLLFDYKENHKHMSEDEQAKEILETMASVSENYTLEALERKFSIPISNGPETELWEVKIPRQEQLAYRDWVNQMPIKDICAKYHIKRRKIYHIRDKVAKYNVHDIIMTRPEGQRKKRSSPLHPVSARNWEIFLYCYQEGHKYTEAARKYGLSKQRVHQIAKKILKHPAAAAVKKHTPPTQGNRRKCVSQKELLRDLVLMCDDESTKKENYAIVSKAYNITPRYVETLFHKYRLDNNSSDWTYHWSPERKELSPEDYHAFLEERNRQIYYDGIELLANLPKRTCKDVWKQLAVKYNLSASRIGVIWWQTRKEIAPPPLPAYRQPPKETYEAVLAEMKENPGYTSSECFRRVAAQCNITVAVVKGHYYKYRKFLMQQEQESEQSPARAQVDEAA